MPSTLCGVRNIFKILGCHRRDDITQKSIGKAKLLLQKGAHQEVWEVCIWGRSPKGFYLMPCCPSPAPGLGRFQAHSLCGWLIRKGPG
jgi:hypothetical protein